MSDWEDVPSDEWEDVPSDAGFFDYLSGVGKRAIGGLSEASGGLELLKGDLYQGIEDYTGLPLGNLADFAKAQGAGLRDYGQELNQEVDQSLPEGLGKRVVDIFGGALPAVASLPLGPMVAATTIGLQSTGRKYGQVTDPENPDRVEGLPAAASAFGSGIVDGGTAAIPLSFIGTSTGPLLRRWLLESAKVGAGNAALAPAQVLGNAAVDAMTLGESPDAQSLGAQTRRSMEDSLISSPLWGLMGATAGRRGPARPNRTMAADAPVSIDNVMEAMAAERMAEPSVVEPQPIAESFMPPAVIDAPTTDVAPTTTDPAAPLALPDPLYENWNAGDGFVYRDYFAFPPAPIEASSPLSMAPEPLPNNFSLQVMPDQAVQSLPKEPLMIGYDPAPAPVQEPSTITIPETFSRGRSPQKQKRLGTVAQEARTEAGRLQGKRIADEQFWAGVPEKSSRPEIPVIKNQSESVAFDDPMAQVREAAQERQAQETPLIATEENAPQTFSDFFRGVVRKAAEFSKNEGGFWSMTGGDAPAPGGRKKTPKQGRGEQVYDKYSKRGPVAPRNLMFIDTIAKDVPEVEPVARPIMRVGEDYSQALGQFMPDLMAMKAVQNDPTVVDAVWKFEELGRQLPINSENVSKLGLNETQAKGVLAVKQMSTRANEMLAAHQRDIANRNLRYSLKRLELEAPAKQAEIKQKYDNQLADLRANAFDPTDLAVKEQAIEAARLKEATAIEDNFRQRASRARAETESLLKSIDERSTAWAETNYVPRNRYGDYQLRIIHPDGEVEVRQTPSKRELAKWKKAYESRGLIVEERRVMEREQTEIHHGISNEVKESVDPIQGFKKHLAKSRRVKGADTDFVRSYAEYIQGLAKKISLERMEMGIKEGLLEVPRDARDQSQVDVAFSPVVNELITRKDALLTPKSGWWGLVSKVADLNFIAGQFRAPIGNLFAIPQRQYPELGKYTSNPLAKITKSVFKNIERMRMSDADFSKKHPELAAGIEQFLGKQSSNLPKGDGVGWWTKNRASYAKQVGRMAKDGLGGNDSLLTHLDDAAFFLQAHSDRFAEANGFITGWDAYPDAVKVLQQKGQRIPNRQEFAEQFATVTKANVPSEYMPSWAHGASRATYLKYKAWQMRFLGALKQAAGEGNWPFLARSLGASLASGGLRALPFYKMTMLALDSMGANPEDALNEYLKEPVARTAIYGPISSASGVNISGSVGFGDPIPDMSRGFEAAMGSLFGGPVTALGKKAIDAGKYGLKGQYIRALEELPTGVPGLSNILKADRIGKEGVITRTGTGVVPKDEVTPLMQGLQALGLQSMKTARAYDRLGAVARAGSEGKDSMGYPGLIARYEIRGDYETANKLKSEARAAGIKNLSEKVKEAKKKASGDMNAILKRFPKANRQDAREAGALFDE